jgi:hypothetical protein
VSKARNRDVGSARVAAKYFPATPPSDNVYLATGASHPDALTGGVLAGHDRSPILMVKQVVHVTEVAAQITRLTPERIVLLGGPDSPDALGSLTVCS